MNNKKKSYIYLFRNNSTKGFSLVEVVMYVSILITILLIVSNSTLLMARAYSGLKISRDINESAVNILERVVRETRVSQSVNISESIFDNDSGVLSVSSMNESDEIESVKFYVENGNLKMMRNLTDLGALNKSNVNVKKMIFRYSDGAVSDLVKIEMELEGMVGGKVKSEVFYDSVVLRGGY